MLRNERTGDKEGSHKGFGFVEFAAASDAADAVDNMHLNKLAGRVLKVNLARPLKGQQQLGTFRAGALLPLPPIFISLAADQCMHSMGGRSVVGGAFQTAQRRTTGYRSRGMSYV